METREILDEIAAERVRQDAKWGGPAHDDEHGFVDWHGFRAEREERIYDAAREKPFDGQQWSRTTRNALVEIAALAVAQIEVLDRNAAGCIHAD